MNFDLIYLKEKLDEKKKQVITEKDKIKISNLEVLLNDESIFFKLDIQTALGILMFLDIPQEHLLETYNYLVSPENFKKSREGIEIQSKLTNNH